MGIIKAEDARKLADDPTRKAKHQRWDEENTAFRQQVDAEIQKAAAEGRYHVGVSSLYDFIDIIDELRGLGYAVERRYVEQVSMCIYLIGWGR